MRLRRISLASLISFLIWNWNKCEGIGARLGQSCLVRQTLPFFVTR